jgi:hypothetical protein
MKTFIRVAEIWVPDPDGYLLEFGGGLYGDAPEFGAISRSMCFGRGEGLPGRVWEEARPVILKDLQGGYFQRAAAAKRAQLSCAVAFPVFFGDSLKAVIVLFCGDGGGHSGGIEVWRNEAGTDADLRLLDGVYGANDGAFATASRDLSLSRGSGLPGTAWQRGASVFVDGVTESTGFVRAAEAAGTGIRQGLAFPCPVPGADSYVLAFLSEPAVPIATRIESWVPDGDGPALKRAYGFGNDALSGPEADRGILEAFAGGMPVVCQAAPGSAGASLIALPVIHDGAVVETVAMHF